MKLDIDESFPVQHIPVYHNPNKHLLYLLNDVHLKNLIIVHVLDHDDHQLKYYPARKTKILNPLKITKFKLL